jgi:hypothetical protein
MEGYPKTKYPTGSGGSVSVTSPEQEKSLGPGWQDHPPPIAESDRKINGKKSEAKRKEEIEAT